MANLKSVDDVKKLITDVMAGDVVLVEAIKEILKNKPSFGDLFKGTFKSKLQVLCKGFATFAAVFISKYLEK